MEVCVEMRSIPRKNELPSDKFDGFINKIWRQPGYWMMSGNSPPKMNRMGDYKSGTQLGKYLGRGFKGYVSMDSRISSTECRKSDDHVEVEFETASPPKLSELLPTIALYAVAFDSYSGFVTTTNVFLADQRGGDRYSVRSIHPITFWSGWYCEKVFSLTTRQVTSAIQEHITDCLIDKDYIAFAVDCKFDSVASTQRVTGLILDKLKNAASDKKSKTTRKPRS